MNKRFKKNAYFSDFKKPRNLKQKPHKFTKRSFKKYEYDQQNNGYFGNKKHKGYKFNSYQLNKKEKNRFGAKNNHFKNKNFQKQESTYFSNNEFKNKTTNTNKFKQQPTTGFKNKQVKSKTAFTSNFQNNYGFNQQEQQRNKKEQKPLTNREKYKKARSFTKNKATRKNSNVPFYKRKNQGFKNQQFNKVRKTRNV